MNLLKELICELTNIIFKNNLVIDMPRVLNIKVNGEGIVLDAINYDENGDFDEREDLDAFGWMMWNDPPREIVAWLKKHLVKDMSKKDTKYDRIDIDVEGVEVRSKI